MFIPLHIARESGRGKPRPYDVLLGQHKSWRFFCLGTTGRRLFQDEDWCRLAATHLAGRFMSSTQTTPAKKTLFAEGFLQDPYPIYQRFLEEGPIHYVDWGPGIWAMFRYADCSAIGLRGLK